MASLGRRMAKVAYTGAVEKRVPSDHSLVHIRLDGLPRTATPADVTRMLHNHKVENISQVNLDYRRFSPSGSAWLTLTHPDFMTRTLESLRKVSLFAHPIIARTAPEPATQRARGTKGREEAQERGVVTGDGSGSGVSDNGKSVILYNLPGKIDTDSVRVLLQGYKLAGGRGEITKLHGMSNAMTSRVLVRLASKSEAYRLVRNLHMVEYKQGVSTGIRFNKYLVHAQVVQ